jgi:ABC-2 type transport system ATP-binding protein
MADRIGIIKDGKLLIEGSLEELRTQAGAQGQSLEDVFLSLTAQPAATRETADAQ